MAVPRLLAIGAAVQDVFLSHSDEFTPVVENPHESFMKLELGAKADVNNITFSTGGGATNAAVTFARQGLHSQFMGTIGHDPAGLAVLDDLDQEGVDTTHISYSSKYNTGYSVLLLAPSGERTILTYRGASTHYDAANFDLRDSNADWLYVSSMAGSMEALDKIFTQARELGIKIMFNPGKGELSQPKKLKALLEDVHILSVNREEMQIIVEGQELEELARHAMHYVPVAIVSDGPNGVVATDGKTIVRAGMYEDVPVIDRTGAGDAFGSGFLSQWAQGKTLKDSIVLASANSTSVVTKIGAKVGILTADAKLHEMPLSEKPF
ncbi:MAG TPA: carbohydrate kinase family protein [Candidatus Saccharimonadales bacterium]|jgi:sugar/nucleoside kinase (ribokinase family)|nr:carbohydrate kinase family protein [Candidatus Saccharimonadales bacterium]